MRVLKDPGELKGIFEGSRRFLKDLTDFLGVSWRGFEEALAILKDLGGFCGSGRILVDLEGIFEGS